MNIRHDWIVLDTNVWIFGLSKQFGQSACAQILQGLNYLYVKIPRQILLELRENLSKDEFSKLFRNVNRYLDRIDIQWNKVNSLLIRKYKQLGCKLGDAVVAAHVEAMRVEILVSENRHFLEEIKELPFRVLNAEKFLQELKKVE